MKEFLASEAMFNLGIPTTRSLSIIVPDDSQNNTLETYPVLTWVASSFLTFGSFEIISDFAE